MSYVALYRKFRPDSFEEVKGQDHIVTTLRNQILTDRIGHAYCFCGTRGTGKTSVAKVFAKAVNCENPRNGSPCNECEMCRRINAGNSLNVIEIDAASNNGVDNIRQIVEEVTYRPAEGKYRVYIIDEVHMLSGGAFNALLKTLEEPPEYVIFILATTEVHKIPVTILSRCQRYDFHRIGIDVITARLEELTAREGIDAERKGLQYIARTSEGAMRDALSMLDQCASFLIGEKLTYEKVLEVLGAADTSVFGNLMQAMLRSDTASVVSQFEELIAGGRDAAQFVTDFTWYLRNLLILKKTGENASELIDLPAEQIREMARVAEAVPENTVIRYIRELSELMSSLRTAADARIRIEVTLIRLCQPENARGTVPADMGGVNTGGSAQEYAQAAGPAAGTALPRGLDPADLLDRLYQAETAQQGMMERIRKLEQMLAEGAARNVQNPSGAQNNPVKTAVQESIPEEPPLPPPAPEELQIICANWQAITAQVREGFSRQLIAKAVPEFDPKEKEPILYAVFSNGLAERIIGKEELTRELEWIISRKYKMRVPVRFRLRDSGSSGLATISVDDVIRSKIHMDIVEEE
ncbi:MAG: DNA polymerase III subunit gamma/tau [Lachnospiraceae bacterium]|nr:DNA polymerase III subunit gamma/tau [Lachnospiraceae bacterium]